MAPAPEDDKDEAPVIALDEDDIALLKTYGLGPYAQRIKDAEAGVKEVAKRVDEIAGVKESDTGLSPPSRWDLVSDKQAMQEEQPLQVCFAACALCKCRKRYVGLRNDGPSHVLHVLRHRQPGNSQTHTDSQQPGNVHCWTIQAMDREAQRYMWLCIAPLPRYLRSL